MLEKLKGYMKEKWKYIIFLLILLLLFYKFGNTYYLENNCILTKYMFNFYNVFILIGLEIATFFWIRFIYYYLSLLVVLNYKKTLLKGDMLFKMVAIILNIIVFETIQFYMLIKFENKNILIILIILIPYVMMLLIHTLLYGDEENEGKKREIILSFIITIILFVLLPPLENIVLVITIYNIVYLLLGEKLVKLKGIKLLLLFIFLILLFYLGFLFRKNWIEVEKIENDYITMSESSL